MDRAGLRAKIIDSAIAIDQGRKWLDTEGFEASGRISYRKGLALAKTAFQEAQILAAKDLEALIVCEYIFLQQELQFCVPVDVNSLSSLSKAIQSFDDALLALQAVEAGASYRIADQTHPHTVKYRYSGMPKDAFHIACAGHKTRIKNILRSPGINIAEKILLEQRLSNLVFAQSVYFEKQKNALSL